MANNSDEQWAWLGLLKWSLAYTDGTSDASPPEMSPEDKAFLESVMKDGIIDENKRMKEILNQVTDQMTKWKMEKWTEEEEGTVEDLLQELRDCVEQIDFARSFAAMKGLEFLLGCAQEREHIPSSVRLLCLGTLATMSSNNPPVQKDLLEMGALKALSDVFFAEEDTDTNGKLRARVMQAIGAIVRSNPVGEVIFGQLEQSPTLVAAGLGMGTDDYNATPFALRQRTLFFLRAIATSDIAETLTLMKRFQGALAWVCDHVVDDTIETSGEIRETALGMIRAIMEQGSLRAPIMSRKSSLVALGVRRVSTLRKLDGEERDYAAVELEHWEALMVLLSRTEDVNDTSEPATSKSLPGQ